MRGACCIPIDALAAHCTTFSPRYHDIVNDLVNKIPVLINFDSSILYRNSHGVENAHPHMCSACYQCNKKLHEKAGQLSVPPFAPTDPTDSASSLPPFGGSYNTASSSSCTKHTEEIGCQMGLGIGVVAESQTVINDSISFNSLIQEAYSRLPTAEKKKVTSIVLHNMINGTKKILSVPPPATRELGGRKRTRSPDSKIRLAKLNDRQHRFKVMNKLTLKDVEVAIGGASTQKLLPCPVLQAHLPTPLTPLQTASLLIECEDKRGGRPMIETLRSFGLPVATTKQVKVAKDLIENRADLKIWHRCYEYFDQEKGAMVAGIEGGYECIESLLGLYGGGLFRDGQLVDLEKHPLSTHVLVMKLLIDHGQGSTKFGCGVYNVTDPCEEPVLVSITQKDEGFYNLQGTFGIYNGGIEYSILNGLSLKRANGSTQKFTFTTY